MVKKRGRGKTTRSPSGMVKKTFWFQPDEAQRLRKEAYERETSQAELVREAVRIFFEMPPKEEEVTGENLAEDVTDDLRNAPTPGLRQELERLLQDYTSSPDQAAEILRTLNDDDDTEGDGS